MHCLESDRHPEVHDLLDEIVQPSLGYGRHCRGSWSLDFNAVE
jgi:hypothetical protein